MFPNQSVLINQKSGSPPITGRLVPAKAYPPSTVSTTELTLSQPASGDSPYILLHPRVESVPPKSLWWTPPSIVVLPVMSTVTFLLSKSWLMLKYCPHLSVMFTQSLSKVGGFWKCATESEDDEARGEPTFATGITVPAKPNAAAKAPSTTTVTKYVLLNLKELSLQQIVTR